MLQIIKKLFIYIQRFLSKGNLRYGCLISFRYMFSKNKKSIVSKITTIAIITTALSIMMPLLMLSLVNGFHDSIKSAIMENEFHLNILPTSTNRIIDDETEENWYENQIQEIIDLVWSINNDDDYKKILPEDVRSEDIPRLLSLIDEDMIQSVILFVEGESIIKTALKWQPVGIRGLSEDIMKSDSFINKMTINAGNFDFSKNYKIMIGKELAEELEINFDKVNMGKGQFVNLITDIGKDGDIKPLNLQHQVASIFTSGWMEIDSQVVFMSVKRAKQLLNKNYYSGIGIQLKDSAYIETMKEVMGKLLKKNKIISYFVKSGTDRYEAQFIVFDWEKNLMFFVVGIMILAAFLTIFITLNILVINKSEEIGILRSTGVNGYTIRLIFIIQGFLIGLVGSVIGAVFGLFLTSSINEVALTGQWVVNYFLDGLYNTPLYDVLNISVKPWEFNIIENSNVLTSSKVNYVIYISDLIIIITGSLFTALMAAFIPSSKAAKESIVEVLRYE